MITLTRPIGCRVALGGTGIEVAFAGFAMRRESAFPEHATALG
ncbi:MAG: hypothetical protein AAF672_13005 [Pseudomonadota bacterium]